MEEFEE
jgi:hypothetical protein